MVRQNLPSKRYVPEEFRNCTQKPFQKCPNIGRNHYCYAAFDRFSVTNESIIDVKDKLEALFKNQDASIHERQLIIIRGAELLWVLSGTISSIITDGKGQTRFIAEVRTLKDFRNLLSHGHKLPNPNLINAEFARVKSLCRLIGIKINRV